jgi:V-type H+-transporting ATPase subunit e
MANGYAPFIGLIVIAIFCGAAWFLSPKGENQTYVTPSLPSILYLP